MKLISIIVPAYNVEQYLGRCLDSILGQTYTNLEILVVDDGSSDRTGAIADEYAQKDDRIKVIHQENKGVSAARNAALKVAGGDFIGCVDSDDRITPGMFERMMEVIDDNGADMAICAYQSVDADSDLKQPERKGTVHLLSGEETLNIYVDDDREFHIYHSVWSRLVRRDILDGLEFPEGEESEEIVYTAKAIFRCSKIVFVDEPLYIYSKNRSSSIMNSKERLSKRRFDEELPHWKEQIAFFREVNLNDLADRAEYQLFRRKLFYYMEFRELKMPEAAGKLAALVKDEKELATQIYQKPFAKSGDRSRMKLFLFSPGLYYLVTSVYNKLIVPLR